MNSEKDLDWMPILDFISETVWFLNFEIIGVQVNPKILLSY